MRRWSLRTRLIAAFAAVIFLTLFLVGIGFLFIFRQQLEQREMFRLASVARQVTFQVQALERGGFTAREIAETLGQQADELDVRVVLANQQGVIFHDTESGLVGQRIDMSSGQRLGPLRRARLSPMPGAQVDPRLFFIAVDRSPPGGTLAERFLGRPSTYVVALVSEPQTLWTALREMASRLLLAAFVSILASIGVAWLLAASIARPLARMTQAAEAVAQGQYDQEIPEAGTDEVGRLATAFNSMTREVARSNRTLRDFVANVSHDLRTPLTSIQGFSQAMVDGTLREREDWVEAGRIVNEETERMRRLVEDLLELSKMEAGQAALDLAEVDFATLVGQAVERAERAAAERRVELVYRPLAAPTVRADTRRIERVVDNLLGNAIKHTPLGGAITVALDRIAESGPRARLAVHNSGSLIPPEDLPRIFERFYQVDKSRAGSAGGSGLGLAIAREIVQAHGGRISANSSPASGTEFTVTIPCLDPVPVVGIGSTPGPRREPVVGRLRTS